MPSANRAPQPQHDGRLGVLGLGAPSLQPQRDPSIGAAGLGAPPPALVPFPRWQKARDRATAAVLAGERRLLVTGPAGTGKTLLLEHVGRTLRAAGWEAAVRLADADPQFPAQTGSAALLVDEADRLPREALQRLLGMPGTLVLAGLETLEARVPGAARITLTALDREEARDYIAQWLALSGRTPAHLATAAMRRVIELSAGVPRLLSSLLGASAWLAETEGAPVISVQHVNDAGALRSCLGGWDDDPEWDAGSETDEGAAGPAVTARRVPAYVPALTAMLLLGAGGFLAARVWPSEAQQAVQLARVHVAQFTAEARARLAGEPVRAAEAAVPRSAQVAAAPSPLSPAVDALIEPPARITASALAQPPAPAAKPVAPEPVAPKPVAAQAAAEEPAVAAEPASAGRLDTAPWTEPPAIAGASPALEPPPAPPEPAAPAMSAAEQIAVPPGPAVIAGPAQPAPVELPAGMVEMLLKRGHDMLAIGDVFAARLLFGRAAEAGNAEAMLAMGRTFDPVALTGTNGLLTPDPAEATRWYRRAAAAGSSEAAELLQRIGRQAAR